MIFHRAINISARYHIKISPIKLERSSRERDLHRDSMIEQARSLVEVERSSTEQSRSLVGLERSSIDRAES